MFAAYFVAHTVHKVNEARNIKTSAPRSTSSQSVAEPLGEAPSLGESHKESKPVDTLDTSAQYKKAATAHNTSEGTKVKDETPKNPQTSKIPPGSVVSINQSGGITAGQINVTGPPPVRLESVQVAQNVLEERPEGQVYKTSIRILLSGAVPRLIVAVSAPSLVDVALVSDSGVSFGSAWPTKDRRGQQSIDNIVGSCMLYLRSKAPEQF